MSKKNMHVVHIIESERGWGAKVDDTYHFEDEQDAKNWVKAYNHKYNNAPTVPDWYMYASYSGQALVDIADIKTPTLLDW